MRQPLGRYTRTAGIAALALSLLSIAAAAVTYASWARDVALLKSIALRETKGFDDFGQRISALNGWVYRNQGFAKNTHYFLSPKLGPTPIDVLNHGGDCADKSRLAAAMLAAIDIESTLAMLYPCENCKPRHTVVEVRHEGLAMVIDPVYDLDFPAAHGGFLGLADLSQDYGAVVHRVHELRNARGPRDKINGFDYVKNSFKYIRTINWNKNWATRLAGTGLAQLGYEPFLVKRPRWLEDPKLFVALTAMGMGLGFLGLAAAFRWLASKQARSERARA